MQNNIRDYTYFVLNVNLQLKNPLALEFVRRLSLKTRLLYMQNFGKIKIVMFCFASKISKQDGRRESIRSFVLED